MMTKENSFTKYNLEEKEDCVYKLGVDELISHISECYNEIDNLTLQIKIKAGRKSDGRKTEVLDLLKNNDSITIVEISERIGITTKNVSSQLTYLRQEGHNICTDSNGRKFLVK
jgi:biotin operon repressor